MAEAGVVTSCCMVEVAHRVFGPIKQQVDGKISSHEINKDTQNNTDSFSHAF
jgi:hypothetical protein